MRRPLVLLAVALAACGPFTQSGGSAGDVILRASPTTARDSVVLTLENRTAATLGYNLCTTALERDTGGGWQSVPEDRVCTMELRTLEPGGSASFTAPLPRERGDYRYVASVQVPMDGAQRSVHSNTLRIQP